MLSEYESEFIKIAVECLDVINWIAMYTRQHGGYSICKSFVPFFAIALSHMSEIRLNIPGVPANCVTECKVPDSHQTEFISLPRKYYLSFEL